MRSTASSRTSSLPAGPSGPKSPVGLPPAEASAAPSRPPIPDRVMSAHWSDSAVGEQAAESDIRNRSERESPRRRDGRETEQPGRYHRAQHPPAGRQPGTDKTAAHAEALSPPHLLPISALVALTTGQYARQEFCCDNRRLRDASRGVLTNYGRVQVRGYCEGHDGQREGRRTAPPPRVSTTAVRPAEEPADALPALLVLLIYAESYASPSR